MAPLDRLSPARLDRIEQTASASSEALAGDVLALVGEVRAAWTELAALRPNHPHTRILREIEDHSIHTPRVPATTRQE